MIYQLDREPTVSHIILAILREVARQIIRTLISYAVLALHAESRKAKKGLTNECSDRSLDTTDSEANENHGDDDAWQAGSFFKAARERSSKYHSTAKRVNAFDASQKSVDLSRTILTPLK